MEKTTNISDLPIKSNTPPIDSNEIEDKIALSQDKLMMDQNIVHHKEEKRVSFSDDSNDEIEEEKPKVKKKVTGGMFVVSDEIKLITLASLLFFIFIDNQFKKYIINILTQIFGNFLKTEMGGTSKVGNLFYALTFGLVLHLFTVFVDYTALQFDF